MTFIDFLSRRMQKYQKSSTVCQESVGSAALFNIEFSKNLSTGRNDLFL